MTSTLEACVFQNQQIPQSVLLLSKIIPDIPSSVLQPILKLVFDTIRKRPVPPKALEVISKKAGLTENVDHLFCGLLMLLQSIFRLPQDAVKEADLRQGLKELKFSDDCSSEFLNALSANSDDLYLVRSSIKEIYFLKLKKLNWRIDITISSNHLSKALETVIIFQMIFNNGDVKSFEVSIAKFHQLRFYVSSMLKELEFIEKKNVLKS